jgi:hypothetical protein
VGVAFCTDLHRLWSGMQGCQCQHHWDQVFGKPASYGAN